MPDIRRQILQRMERQRLTINAVATRVQGVSRSQVYLWLTGKSDISLQGATAIAAAVGLRLNATCMAKIAEPM